MAEIIHAKTLEDLWWKLNPPIMTEEFDETTALPAYCFMEDLLFEIDEATFERDLRTENHLVYKAILKKKKMLRGKYFKKFDINAMAKEFKERTSRYDPRHSRIQFIVDNFAKDPCISKIIVFGPLKHTRRKGFKIKVIYRTAEVFNRLYVDLWLISELISELEEAIGDGKCHGLSIYMPILWCGYWEAGLMKLWAEAMHEDIRFSKEFLRLYKTFKSRYDAGEVKWVALNRRILKYRSLTEE